MNKELAEAIGARVKYRREQLDLSQEELAKKAGYNNKSMISRIEHGSFVLSNDKIYILAKALEITTEFLLGGLMKIMKETVGLDLYQGTMN